MSDKKTAMIGTCRPGYLIEDDDVAPAVGMRVVANDGEHNVEGIVQAVEPQRLTIRDLDGRDFPCSYNRAYCIMGGITADDPTGFRTEARVGMRVECFGEGGGNEWGTIVAVRPDGLTVHTDGGDDDECEKERDLECGYGDAFALLAPPA